LLVEVGVRKANVVDDAARARFGRFVFHELDERLAELDELWRAPGGCAEALHVPFARFRRIRHADVDVVKVAGLDQSAVNSR
jgi:hypothetical protein